MFAMSILESVNSPEDLKNLPSEKLPQLASEIRQFLIEKVSNTGGHLGPNLGVVELTMALHLVFDSPKDPILFDTGHQSYVHKILTGRREMFDQLRQKGGLSGYPSRAESEHDWIENSHASVSLGWADGLAKAFKLKNEPRTVVAVIGDGALTGGVSWEALNNIAVGEGMKLVVVINDNGRSYRPTVGGMAKKLAAIRTDPRYEPTLSAIKRGVSHAPIFGKQAYDLLHGLKAGIKDTLMPEDGLYSDLGIKYLGPINGHNLDQLVSNLQLARDYDGQVIVHVITNKGRGYLAAENNVDDQFHAIGKINAETGEPLVVETGQSWTDVFSKLILAQAQQRKNLVGITAAMLKPVGLEPFANQFPDRVFDVGIAEQQAVTCAAGLAAGGMHPVVAVYSTFLNRAFDQVLLDVGLHNLGVTFVLDRAGVTGSDGPSHNGIWDVPMLSIVPNLKLATPRDEAALARCLDQALDIDDCPTVIRFSKESCPPPMPAIRSVAGIDYLVERENAKVLLIGYGQFAQLALQVAEKLTEQNIAADVVDPLWALPVSDQLVELAGGYSLVATLEDNVVDGGIGTQLGAKIGALVANQSGVEHRPQLLQFGVPKTYLAQASRGQVLAECGLDTQTITSRIADLAK